MWLCWSGQVAHATPDWRLRRTVIFNKIKETKYLKAEKLQSEGKLSEAFDIFFMLRDYKDSADKSAVQWHFMQMEVQTSIYGV